MVAWSVKDFGGLIPKTQPRIIPDQMASDTLNCDLSSGALAGLPVLSLVKDLSTVSGSVQRAYRFPDAGGMGADAWLPLPSPYSSAVPSPLANDTRQRIYWTNPNDGAYFTTYAAIIDGTAPFNLGFTAPDISFTPVVTATGGTPSTQVPYVERSYVVTFIDAFGLESSPSPASTVVAGASDGTWTITLPRIAPGSPSGKTYPTVVSMWLYRTVSGQNTGAQFYRVVRFDFATSPPPTGGYNDVSADTTVVNNLPLYSTEFAPPPDGLDGLVAFPGGMLVGFTGNTLHFCEPNYPHAWPAQYDISVKYPIQAIAVWQTNLVVLTKGVPSTGTGTTPATFTLQEIQVHEPCIARGSVVTELTGVYYASQNGLINLNYYGMQNLTVNNFTKNLWLTTYQAASIIACRHRSQYFALTTSGDGFLVDLADQRQGVMPIDTQLNATCIWNDPYTGSTYICADKKVYLWDDPSQMSQAFRWTSKWFYLPAPGSLGAVQLTVDPSVSSTLPALPTFDTTNPTVSLPSGINAQFTMYADDMQVMKRDLTGEQDIFRLPSGFKAFKWYFEIVSRVPVYEVQIATTMKELRSV
jgi:hypothetical protein